MKHPRTLTVAHWGVYEVEYDETGEAIKQIYQGDASVEIKKEAINALFLQNNGRILVELARAEKDPAMKKEMVSKMSIMGKSKEVTDYLLELLK